MDTKEKRETTAEEQLELLKLGFVRVDDLVTGSYHCSKDKSIRPPSSLFEKLCGSWTDDGTFLIIFTLDRQIWLQPVLGDWNFPAINSLVNRLCPNGQESTSNHAVLFFRSSLNFHFREIWFWMREQGYHPFVKTASSPSWLPPLPS